MNINLSAIVLTPNFPETNIFKIPGFREFGGRFRSREGASRRSKNRCGEISEPAAGTRQTIFREAGAEKVGGQGLPAARQGCAIRRQEGSGGGGGNG